MVTGLLVFGMRSHYPNTGHNQNIKQTNIDSFTSHLVCLTFLLSVLNTMIICCSRIIACGTLFPVVHWTVKRGDIL